MTCVLCSRLCVFACQTSAQILDIQVLSCTHTQDVNRSCPAMAVHHRQEHFTLAPCTSRVPSADLSSLGDSSPTPAHKVLAQCAADTWTRVSTLTMGSGRLADAEGLYMGMVQVTYTGERSSPNAGVVAS